MQHVSCMGKIKSFTDLDAWKEGHTLLLTIYKITRLFPDEEKFCFVDQMRRSSLSITSNIAEGFSRRSNKEKSQFYYTALGSVTELQNQLLASRDLGYITSITFRGIAQQTVTVNKLLNGLIKSAKYLIRNTKYLIQLYPLTPLFISAVLFALASAIGSSFFFFSSSSTIFFCCSTCSSCCNRSWTVGSCVGLLKVGS